MAEPSRALHKEVFGKLSGLSCGAYDAVPQGAAMPYVVLDTMLSESADRLTSRSDERFIYLSIWSESRGQAEILGIIGELDAIFNDAQFSLDTGEVFSCRMLRANTQRDADNETFMGQVTLRILTNH